MNTALFLFESKKRASIFGQILYEISFTCFIVLVFLQATTYISFVGDNTCFRISFICIFAVLLKIYFIDISSLKEFLIDSVFFTLLLITWRTSHDFNLLSTGIFIVGAKNIKFERIVKIYFWTTLMLIIFVICSSSLGIIRNLIYYRNGPHSPKRQSFGAIYPTDFASHIVFTALAYCYLKFKQLKWVDYLFFIILAVFVIKLCDARLSAACLIIIIPVMYIAKKAYEGKTAFKLISAFYWTIAPLLAYLIICLSIFYSANIRWMEKINKLLSDRLIYGHKAVTRYGFSLFGTRLTEHGWGGIQGQSMSLRGPQNYFFVDSSFLRMTLLYGVVAAVVVILIMVIIARRSILSHEYALAGILVVVAISALVEQRLLDLSYNPFLIAFVANLPLINEIKRGNYQ